MRLIPTECHDGPQTITPMIKIFLGLIIVNLLCIPATVAWALYVASPFPSSRTPYLWITRSGGYVYFPVQIHSLLLGWICMNVILVFTFVWLNSRSELK